jgi:hypothetical protein
MLEKASQWLGNKIANSLSNEIVYKRGAVSVPLAASRQKTTYEVIDFSGMVVKVESHDFVVLAESLVDGSTLLTPLPQDTIEVTVGTVKSIFEVQALSQPNGTREQAYKPCDSWGHQIRIFTKFKENVNV